VRLPTPYPRSTNPLVSPPAFAGPSPYLKPANKTCRYCRAFCSRIQTCTLRCQAYLRKSSKESAGERCKPPPPAPNNESTTLSALSRVAWGPARQLLSGSDVPKLYRENRGLLGELSRALQILADPWFQFAQADERKSCGNPKLQTSRIVPGENALS
jgi:hypothetical protein